MYMQELQLHLTHVTTVWGYIMKHTEKLDHIEPLFPQFAEKTYNLLNNIAKWLA